MLAFFAISTHLGGAEKSLLDLVIALKDQNKEFVVVVPKNFGPLIDELNHHQIQWKLFPLPSWLLGLSRNRALDLILNTPYCLAFFPKLFRQLHQFIIENEIQTIHSTGLKFHLLLGLYAHQHTQLRLIIHLRDIVHNKVLKKIFHWLSKKTNISWVANSQITAQSIDPIESQVIYNGFPLRIPSTRDRRLKEELKISQNTPLIGIVGALARWKGQREFIAMAAQLIAQKKPYHFVIVGSEIYDTKGEKGEREWLQQQVEKLGLGHRIHFLAFQKDIQKVYGSLDVLVHASIKPEPFGRVIVEAMACGVAITAAQIGGPTEIIEPFQNGLLHPPGDISAMAQNVAQLIDHPEDTQKIIAEAYKQPQRFSLQNHLQNLTPLLYPKT